MRRWWQCASLRALVGSTRGVAAIEFGLICIPLLALMIATIQVSLVFFAQQNLETANEKAVRKLVTGSAQKAKMTKEQFTASVCSNLPSFMKCANLMVDVRVATSFSSGNALPVTFNAKGDPQNNSIYSPGSAGEITVVKAMYVWDVQKGPLGFDLSTMSRNRRMLVATSIFKTEIYS